MKEIRFKTLGYIAIEVTEKLSRGGKVRQVINALSTKIYKRRGDATKLQNKFKEEKKLQTIEQHFEVLKHALNIEQLRKDVLIAKENIRKGKSKAFNWIKGIWSNSVNYFRLQCAKIKLFRYINSLNRNTKMFVNDFLEYSQSFGCIEFNFNLNKLNIN
jgi:hypothetical protein